MIGGDFLALDWGTTNLRACVVGQDGGVLRREDFALGIGGLAAGEAEQCFRDRIRPAMAAEHLPAMLCGMVGSNLGWTAVPYLDCPVGLDGLGCLLHRVKTPGPPVWIVPGLRAERPDGGPDVMRGEETQIFGRLRADRALSRGEHLLCLPGTHTKWVRIVDGRIETFVTSMTGELFALLRAHSALRVTSAKEDADAFRAGVEMAGDGIALASRLFTTRARVVGGTMMAASAESYLSGLLIGADVASSPALLGVAGGTQVGVVGDPRLCRFYRTALESHGFAVSACDGEAAVLAGLRALFMQAPATC